jgi:hypothetical protein
MEDLLRLAHHPTSSRVLDAILESPTVSFKVKRNFVISLIGHYHLLVDDRIGSRVADRCWAFADPYLRVCPIYTDSLTVLMSRALGKDSQVSLCSRTIPRGLILWQVLRAEPEPLLAAAET